jgi:hypothetical protein
MSLPRHECRSYYRWREEYENKNRERFCFGACAGLGGVAGKVGWGVLSEPSQYADRRKMADSLAAKCA